jgi:hypothetical protein
LRTLDPLTGEQVDALTVAGGTFTQVDVIGKDRLGLTANMSGDGPVAGTLSEVWTGAVVWRHELPSHDPASNLIETTLFGAGVAVAQVSGSYLQLIDKTGASAGSFPDYPADGYSQPLLLTSLPDGRLVAVGRSSNPSGVYVNFLRP